MYVTQHNNMPLGQNKTVRGCALLLARQLAATHILASAVERGVWQILQLSCQAPGAGYSCGSDQQSESFNALLSLRIATLPSISPGMVINHLR